MTDSLRFAEAAALHDLGTYVSRARRIQEQGIRLQAAGQVLALWVPVMTPSSLVGRLPAVLGLRTAALAEASAADVTVELGAMAERIARLSPADTELALPPAQINAPWAAVTPPRSGWEFHGELSDTALGRTAEAGIAEIAETVPDASGAAVVEQVRETVWGRPMEDAAHLPGHPQLPAGAAFGAHALGFLRDKDDDAVTQVHSHHRWVRLSSARGYIVARRSG